MVVFRKKKCKKLRGSKTHGWGAMKKHRGAGNRGGRGMAGSGKRGDAIKPLLWKERYFGKHGFKKKGLIKRIVPINVGYFEEHLESLLKEGKAITEKGTIVIDAEKLGYNKILGNGAITKKFRIIAESFSKIAAEKIKNVGGEVVESKTAEKTLPEEPEAEQQAS